MHFGLIHAKIDSGNCNNFFTLTVQKFLAKRFFFKFPFHNNRTCFQTFIFYLRTAIASTGGVTWQESPQGHKKAIKID